MRKTVLFLLLLSISAIRLQANTSAECDTLIQKGVIARNNKEHTLSLKLFTDAKTIAENNNCPKQLFLALNNIGLNYYVLQDYGEALNHYLEAYKTALKELDASSEMIVLNNIAVLYSKEKKIDKAEEYFGKAFAIASENGDSLKTGMYAVNLAIVAKGKGELNKAWDYVSQALQMLQKQPVIYRQTLLVKAEILVLRGELDVAEKIIRELVPQLQTPVFAEHRTNSLLQLSKIYDLRHNLKQATDYALQALGDSVNIENKIEIFSHLSSLYRKNGDINRAFHYRDAADEAKDSLTAIKNTMLFENSRTRFELRHYQEELLRSKEKLQNERKIFIIVSLSVILLLLAMLLLLRNNTVKYRQRKKIAELELEKERNSHLLLAKQLTEKETLSQLEQERLKNEIEAKNRKLTAKALQMASKNELIEHILQSLSVIPEISRNSIIVRQINQLKNKLKENSNEWQNFLTHFEEVNKGFIAALNSSHPDLTSNDLRVLSYIYMNLNSKEISSLLNITYDAYRKRKERICHKMNIAEDVDLYHYLSTLS